MEILIIKPSSFGDIVQALPCANALKHYYSGCRISWVVFSNWESVLKICPDVDKIIVWDRKKIRGFFETLKQTRRIKYDLIIDLQGLFRSAFLAKLSSAKIKIGVPKMKEFGNFLVKQVCSENKVVNATLRNLETVRFLTGKTFNPKVNIKLSSVSKRKAEHIFKKEVHKFCNSLKNNSMLENLDDSMMGFSCNKIQRKVDKSFENFVSLLPFARGKGKDWSISNYHKLIDLIGKEYRGMRIVVLGEVESYGKLQSREIVDLCGKTDIEELASILSKSKIAIGADTGPMHLASVLQIPSVFIFGNSNVNETAPCVGQFSLILNKDNPKNINDIKPEIVFAEIKKWVKCVGK
jgi:ADP-heptose:LPS heptosyltransferase